MRTPPPDIVAYTDGGSRGNPGPAGFGVRLEAPDGTLVHQFCQSVGVATNNVAEYRGLIAALTWAAGHGYRRPHVRSDSELLVRQMRGEYRVKNAGLQPLVREAREIAGQFERVSFEHVRRELNREADRLANLAMDNARDCSKQPPSTIEPSPVRRPPRTPPQGDLPFDDRLPDNSAPKK